MVDPYFLQFATAATSLFIAVALALIGFFGARWMASIERKIDCQQGAVSRGETDIAVLKVQHTKIEVALTKLEVQHVELQKELRKVQHELETKIAEVRG